MSLSFSLRPVLAALVSFGFVSSAVAEDTIIKFDSPDGRYHYSIETAAAPELKEWAGKELVPVIQEWYPRIVTLLPSDNFTPPTTVIFEFKTDMKGVPAWASGNKISMNAAWYGGELKREARGCTVHEMVHVVQQYGHGRGPAGAAPAPVPGWIGEGIPDYIRWFLYEPQSRGAEITAGNLAAAKFDGNYRISANFLDWVVRTKNKDLIVKLNDASRKGVYSPQLWKDWTGKTVEELGAEWKKDHEVRLAQPGEGKK